MFLDPKMILLMAASMTIIVKKIHILLRLVEQPHREQVNWTVSLTSWRQCLIWLSLDETGHTGGKHTSSFQPSCPSCGPGMLNVAALFSHNYRTTELFLGSSHCSSATEWIDYKY